MENNIFNIVKMRVHIGRIKESEHTGIKRFNVIRFEEKKIIGGIILESINE